MAAAASHALPQVVCAIRRVQEETIAVKVGRTHFQHGFRRLERRHHIFHVPPLHHESLVRQCGQIGEIGVRLLRLDFLFQCLAAGKDVVFRNALVHERLFGAGNLVFRVLKLQVEEFLHRAHGLLP